MFRSPLSLACAALAALALILSACGGGSSSTGATTPMPVATADTGLSSMSGTVTGFGSVIIDGVRIDNHAVLADRMDEDGSTHAVELKLGQHVEALHDEHMVATALHVMAEAEGAVSKVDTAAGSLVVDGQTIVVNTDPKAGPVTVFGAPYTGLADIKVGDRVEAHGLVKTDAGGASYIQATRIEPTSGAEHDRVAGIISDLSTSAKTFKLGGLLIDYSSANILPSGATLANGELVHVAIPLGTVNSGAAVHATVVRVSDHRGDSHTHPSEVGGAITSIDTAAKSFMIGGVKVDASGATYPQAGKSFADLQVGSYVVAVGTYDSSGVLKASSVMLRSADDVQAPGTVELHGTILNYVSLADFTVRDVHVDASAAKLGAGCGTTLANGMQVEVLGTLGASGVVKATSVTCEPEVDGQSIIGAIGTASAVDATAKRFTLTGETKTYTVNWTATTLFLNVDASSLSGKRVAVEGTLSGTTITAAKVVLLNH